MKALEINKMGTDLWNNTANDDAILEIKHNLSDVYILYEARNSFSLHKGFKELQDYAGMVVLSEDICHNINKSIMYNDKIFIWIKTNSGHKTLALRTNVYVTDETYEFVMKELGTVYTVGKKERNVDVPHIMREIEYDIRTAVDFHSVRKHWWEDKEH